VGAARGPSFRNKYHMKTRSVQWMVPFRYPAIGDSQENWRIVSRAPGSKSRKRCPSRQRVQQSWVGAGARQRSAAVQDSAFPCKTQRCKTQRAEPGTIGKRVAPFRAPTTQNYEEKIRGNAL